MANKKITGLVFLAIFLILGVSGVPVMAQFDAVPQLSYDLWTLSWDDISVDTGAGLKLQMIPIGVDFNIVILDDDPMYEGLQQIPRTFTTYEMSHGYGSVPDHVWWRMHSDNIIDWGNNFYGLNNATVDYALDSFMGATPAQLPAQSQAVQIAAKQNMPYIPLFLSDDTHAIRKEWTNYTLKPGGVFTSFNPQTPVFMYNTTNLPAGRTGIEFIMAYPSDIGELNPMFWRSERSHWYDMLVYDTLITYDPVTMAPIPWLAESFSVAANGLQVNFTIRTGAEWHDGTAVTPDDVEFSILHHRDGPEDTVQWSFLQRITSTAIDGNTVVFNLDQPSSFALQIIGDLYILPEHIRGGIPADDARWNDHTNVTAQTGSGPFRYVSRIPDETTVVERYPNWWGPSYSYIGALPTIERLRIDVVRGQDARILAMRAGDADTERYEVFGAYVNTILNAPELDLVTGLTSQWDYVIGFATNLTVWPSPTTPTYSTPGQGINDIRVRQAISLAINRQQLVNIGRLGFGTPTNSVIPYEFWPTLYHPNGAFEEDDVAGANAILDAAGYFDVDGDGIREFPGVTVPPAPPNLLFIGIAGVVALVIGIVIAYLIMRMRK